MPDLPLARAQLSAAERRYLAARDAGQRDIDEEITGMAEARAEYRRALRAEAEGRARR